MIMNLQRIGFNTIMLLGMSMRGILVGLFSVLLLLFSIDSVSAESEEIDVSIGFDFAFGEIIQDEKIISGTVVVRKKQLKFLGRFIIPQDSNIIGVHSMGNQRNLLL